MIFTATLEVNCDLLGSRSASYFLELLGFIAGWKRCSFEPFGGGLLVSLKDFSVVVRTDLFSSSFSGYYES